jgi:uncharacterized protein (DUF305 family)
MNNQPLVFALLGMLVGGLVVGVAAVVAVNAAPDSTMHMMGMHSDHHSGIEMSMDGMTGRLAGKSGDDFDRAFLDGMIEHHRGAVTMAKLAQQNAKHEELKQMAAAIISAQQSEINQMQQWQMDWGYETASTMPHMSH